MKGKLLIMKEPVEHLSDKSEEGKEKFLLVKVVLRYAEVGHSFTENSAYLRYILVMWGSTINPE